MENASPYPVTTYYFLILIFPLFSAFFRFINRYL